MKSQIITFENPPVNEVVISTYFNPPLSDFRNEHIGLFWERIRGEFPIVRQQLPVELDWSSPLMNHPQCPGTGLSRTMI